MVYIRPLSAAERRELRRRARSEVGRVSERIRMVLLSDRRYSVPQIAGIFECSEATVRGWLTRFATEGIAGLYDRPRMGRPRQADAVARETIRRTVAVAPAAAGYGFGFWTVVTLSAHLAQQYGLHLSCSALRRVLQALDYRWRRPRHCLPVDPAAPAKMAALCRRFVHAPAEAVFLCEDESDVQLLPLLRAMWMRRGQQVRVPTPGTNRKRTIFGALEWDTGRWLYTITERKRTVEFLAFLEQALAAYPGRPVLLVLDNASIHTAKAVAPWLAAHPRLELLYLPTYSGHAQNPVEKVWWRLKDQVAANRLYSNIDALMLAVHAFFAAFTPQDARRLAA
jgi:transposase